MKKIVITAACFALGGMMTSALACGGSCGGKKSADGDGSKESLTAMTVLGDATVFCGGSCSGDKKSEDGGTKES